MAVVRVVGLVPSRELCGTTEEQFAELLVRLTPLMLERRRCLADRPDRKRAAGAGRRPTAWWLRLMVALTHLRQGTSVRATAAVFGIHERSVRRFRDEVEELLVDHGFQPAGATRPIRSLEDLGLCGSAPRRQKTATALPVCSYLTESQPQIERLSAPPHAPPTLNRHTNFSWISRTRSGRESPKTTAWCRTPLNTRNPRSEGISRRLPRSRSGPRTDC